MLSLIVSTPRCGSSTIQRAANLISKRGEFLREPFNPMEAVDYVPAPLRGLGMVARAEQLTRAPHLVAGLKHVYSPFVPTAQRAEGLNALATVMRLPGVRVVLITRRNLWRQFISLEIAQQTGDWWSEGIAALPREIGPIRAGCSAPLTDQDIERRIEALAQANAFLRCFVRDQAAVMHEAVYEDLFYAPADGAVSVLKAVLGHLGVASDNPCDGGILQAALRRGDRRDSLVDVYEELSQRHPVLLPAHALR